MTPRERLFAVLDGEPTDRIPIWLLFPYHPTGYYVDVRNHAGYRRIFDHSAGKVIMLDRRNPEQPPLFIEDPELTDPVRSDEDLKRVLSMNIVRDRQEIESALDNPMAVYEKEKAEFPIENGAMMLDLGEPINWLYHNSDMESFAIWSLTHGDAISDFLDRIQERLLSIYRYFLERDAADVYFLVGSELAAPPMVSRATFQRWIVPYATGLIDLIHSYGKRVIQHFHGQIYGILDDFVAMGADAVHTIEAPPIGNCTFTEAFDRVGDSMALIGNIQYDDFRAMTHGQMRNAVLTVLEECKGRRLILSPSAGPFDENLSDHMLQNYLTFIDTAWDWGS